MIDEEERVNNGTTLNPKDYMEPNENRMISNIIMGILIVILVASFPVTMMIANNKVGVEVTRKSGDNPGPHPQPEPEPEPEPIPIEFDSNEYLETPRILDISNKSIKEQSQSNVNTLEVDGDSIEEHKADLSYEYLIIFPIQSFLLSCLCTYLGFSFFNQKKFLETFNSLNRKILIPLISIVLAGGLSVAFIFITNKVILKNHITNSYYNYLLTKDEPKGYFTINGGSATLTSTYETTNSDENVILAKNGAKVTLLGAEVKKSGGDSSNTENSEFYGINAAVLATGNSTLIFIYGSTIYANATGANAVFSTKYSEIIVIDSIINTVSSSSSRGLDSTYGGNITAKNVTITTQGGSCATLATDRGEGYVTCIDCKLTTNGAGSPVIYSTGVITMIDGVGNSNGAQCVVVEGKNSAIVTNSKITSVGKGNRGDTDSCGVMIYQSMSGDADVGVGSFTCTNSELSVTTAGIRFFFITNTAAEITLTNCTLNFDGNFLDILGTGEWGEEGKNGGNVTFNGYNQTIEGDITVDEISKLDFKLYGSSIFNGSINAENTTATINVVIEDGCNVTLTEDSYVTSYAGPVPTGKQFIIIGK